MEVPMSSMESSEVQEQQRRWEEGVAAGFNSGEAAAYAEGRLELPSLSYTALRHVRDDGSTVAEYAVNGESGEVIFALHDLHPLRGLPLDALLADVPSAEVFELRLEQAGVREEKC
jgi:hypothetical protein